jgi:hypothetical protein
MGPRILLRLGIVAAVATALIACTIEPGDAGYGPAGGQPVYFGPGDAGTTGSGGSPNPSPIAILARLDPNVKMTASPGQGVGVFTEYEAGGHWHVWWTCDTSLTSQTCPFDVKLSVDTGAISGAASEGFAATDTLRTPATPGAGKAGEVEAKTVTATGVQGVLFETDPGATITLTATVGGLYSGQFFFWVQSGKINGGYTGTVTDPLMLVGASP